MLNVQLVIFPRLEGLVEAAVAFHRVVHEDGAPSTVKNKRIGELVLSLEG